MILESLEKNKEKRLGDVSKTLENNRLLVENTQDKERDILKRIGLDMHIKAVEDKLELQVKNTLYEAEYKSKIFHISEIKKMCMDYRFFMRKADQYRGTIPDDLGLSLVKFEQETKVAIASTPSYNDFYILAPPNCFKGYTPFTEKVKDLLNLSNKSFKDFFTPKLDPILLYRLPDGEHFAFLRKWGNDINIFRKFTSEILKTNFRVKFYCVLFCIFLICLPSLIIYYFPDGILFEEIKGRPTVSGILFGAISGIFWFLGTIFSFAVSNQLLFKNNINLGSTEKNWRY
jgi:hypothetical protein